MLTLLTGIPGFAQQKSKGDTRTKEVKNISDNTYLLTATSSDKTYGYQKENPVKVGPNGGGPKNERRFLNALLGPKGEPVEYWRRGSCCPFETPNGLLENQGLLDIYALTIVNSNDTVVLYFNMYDEGDLEISLGFKAKE